MNAPRKVFLKKVTLTVMNDALQDVRPLVSAGNFDDAFELLREKYRIGPQTQYTRGRTLLFLLGEYWQETVEFRPANKPNVFEFIKRFIESGADVNVQDKYGMTPLQLAAYRLLPEFCQLLLDCGAKVDLANNNDKTALDEAIFGYNYAPYARDSYNERRAEIFAVLLRAGADPYRVYTKNVHIRFDGAPIATPADAVITKSEGQLRENPEEHPMRRVFFKTLAEMGVAAKEEK